MKIDNMDLWSKQSHMVNISGDSERLMPDLKII
jgi:hypothetical protein